MENEQKKFKILMFPWLAHGHINPFLQFGKRLARRKSFTIYLCTTPINLESIKTSNEKTSSADDNDASIKLVELHVPPLPELPPEMHTTKNLPSNLIPTLMKAFQSSSSSFSDIMNSIKPDLLIYDLFQPWAPKLASSRGIPSVYFSTGGATPFAFFHHIHTMGTASPFPYPAIYLLDHEWVEVINESNSITQNLKDADEDFASENLTLSTDIVLVRSSGEFDEKYIEYLSILSKKQIVPTGSLLEDANDNDYDNGDKECYSEIMKWLSGKNQCSTVYISFGTECSLSTEQITEIAKGLETSSNVNFIWVIRGKNTTSVDEQFPAGFLETVRERGLIIQGWAPQAKILEHPSIGGFVSHCGWSSCMESMYFGVPIVAMPMRSEQPINARGVVEAGVGVEVKKDGDGRFGGEEVAKAINKVIVEKEFCEGVRDRAKRLSEKMKDNAEREMNEAAEQLLRICLKSKI